MSTLYVTEQGARIEKEYLRIIVTLDGEVIQSVPLRSVSQVVLVGSCGATTQAMLALLDANVGLTFISRTGRLRGRLQPPLSANLDLRLKQYACQSDKQFCLEITRSIALGKLSNYRVMAQRILRSLAKDRSALAKVLQIDQPMTRLQENYHQLERIISKIDDLADIDVIRGYEGIGSKLYFSILRAGLNWQGERKFSRRQRRPPQDPVNALLSLGYTLLGQSMLAAVEIAGLDPLAGFLHTNQYGRMSLALDLIEEFRPLIVDTIVRKVVNLHMITGKHFENGYNDGLFLTKKGLRIFFDQYHKRINQEIMHPAIKKKLTYQKCFEVQANQVRKLILGDQGEYVPLVWR